MRKADLQAFTYELVLSETHLLKFLLKIIIRRPVSFLLDGPSNGLLKRHSVINLVYRAYSRVHVWPIYAAVCYARIYYYVFISFCDTVTLD